jgi:hypothetical protein
MRCRRLPFLVLWMAFQASCTPAAQLVPLSDLRQGQVAEIRLVGIPGAVNPFDPDEIAVDLRIRNSSGTDRTVAGFWYQPFIRALRNQQEILTPSGSGEWRARWLAEGSGDHRLSLIISTHQGRPKRPSSPTSPWDPPPKPRVRSSGSRPTSSTSRPETANRCPSWVRTSAGTGVVAR